MFQDGDAAGEDVAAGTSNKIEKHQRLDAALDKLRACYGRKVIHQGDERKHSLLMGGHPIYEPEAARLGLQPAKLGDVPDCLVAQLDHRMSQAISLVIRYWRQSNDDYHYAAAEHHSAFPLIFN